AAVAGRRIRLQLHFSDLDCSYLLVIENSVLNYFKDRLDDAADATLTLSALNFKRLLMGLSNAPQLITEGQLEIAGDPETLLGLKTLFDQFPRRYPLVTPRPADAP
ncbi:MAG TPA: hypothetical protein DCP57_08165, partial [Gammaproteobacteria bacterium]|nr:hypothetical protein [Gammaproteobacteria bacterium]